MHTSEDHHSDRSHSIRESTYRNALARDEPFHIIRFSWNDLRPELVAVDLREREIVTLDLWDLDWRITDRRVCVGRFTGDGYEPCPVQRPVSRFSQCSNCGFIPDLECIFDPKCGGDYCDTEFCSRDHAVYLAIFGSTLKVGMTGYHRVRERLVEQGADAYTVLARASNRWAARGLEKTLARNLELRQMISGKAALGIMAREEVPLEAASAAFEAFSERTDASVIEHAGKEFLGSLTGEQLRQAGYADRSDLQDIFEYGAEMDELVALAGYPIELPLESMPEIAGTGGIHSGEVVGAKGKFLVYRTGTPGDAQGTGTDGGLRALHLQSLEARLMWK